MLTNITYKDQKRSASWFSIKLKYLVLCLPVLLILNINDGFLGWITLLSGSYFLYRFFSFLDRIGSEILVLDLIEMLVILQWLFAPALYYLFYTHNLVKWEWWYYKMKVEPEAYFLLSIPCSLTFIVGLRLYYPRLNYLLNLIFLKLKALGKHNFKTGLLLSIFGIIASVVGRFVSIELSFIFTLLSTCLYVGVLYIYFSNHSLRIPILLVFVFYIVYNAVNSGMFGAVIWWPLLLVMFITFGYKISFYWKFAGAVSLFIIFSILQSVKSQYRFITWRGVGANKYENSSNSEILQSLVSTQVKTKGFNMLDWNSYFSIVSRLNQGFHVTRAMTYTPSVEPYAYGETIFLSLVASFVPRIFWADKPKAGGKENYFRFTGIRLNRVSMNIGQIGDAYVNFTMFGAPIFLLLYGLFLQKFFLKIITRSLQHPTLILWIPFFFIELLNVENDFFTTFNYALKSFLFVVFIFWFLQKGLKFKL